MAVKANGGGGGTPNRRRGTKKGGGGGGGGAGSAESSQRSQMKRRNSAGAPKSLHEANESKLATVTASNTITSKAESRRELSKPGGPETFSDEAKNVMRKFTHEISKNGLHTLRLQYDDMKKFVPADASKTGFEANVSKCRYKDIPCWDRTRVVLHWPPGCGSDDFIHANWVTHDLLENQFICTQGPMDGTLCDFWRMVWQEKVRQIIMLCRCEEMGKSKCSQYWPLNPGDAKTHGPLTVKCEHVNKSDTSFIHTKLQLTHEKEVRHIDHRQWMTWPDKSVPKTPMAPFRLLQFTRRQTKHPSVIHCSAGVGRTGTLVAIELVYKSLFRAKMPDMVQFVKELRSQRSHAVQTEDQYIYCHYAILQLLHIKHAVSAHDIKHFCKEYENYLKLLNDHGGKHLPLTATSLPAPCDKECKSTAPEGGAPADETNIDVEDKKKDVGSKRTVKRRHKAEHRADDETGLGADDRESKIESNKKKRKAKKEKEKKDAEEKKAPEGEEGTPAPVIVASKEKESDEKDKDGKEEKKDGSGESKENKKEKEEVPPEQTGREQRDKRVKERDDQQQQQPGLSQEPTSAENVQQQQPQMVLAHTPVSLPPPPVCITPPPPSANTPGILPSAASPIPTQSSGEKKKIEYRPAHNYVVTQADGTRKVVYSKPSAPFIKALAAPQGQVQQQILVNGNTGQTAATTPPVSSPVPQAQSLPPSYTMQKNPQQHQGMQGQQACAQASNSNLNKQDNNNNPNKDNGNQPPLQFGPNKMAPGTGTNPQQMAKLFKMDDCWGSYNMTGFK